MAIYGNTQEITYQYYILNFIKIQALPTYQYPIINKKLPTTK